LRTMPYWTSFWTIGNTAPAKYETFEVRKPFHQNMYPPFTHARQELRDAFAALMNNGPSSGSPTAWEDFMQEYTNPKRTYVVREKALIPLYGRVARGCIETMTDLSDVDHEMELLDYALFTPQIEVDVATVGF
jgi:hypothetical protein